MPETVSTSCPPTKSVSVTVAPARVAPSASEKSMADVMNTAVEGGPLPSLKVAVVAVVSMPPPGTRSISGASLTGVTATDDAMLSEAMLSLAPPVGPVSLSEVRVTTRVAAPGLSLVLS